MYNRRFLLLAPVISALSLFISCPNPTDLDVLNHVKDEIGPVITLISPEEGSYCAKTMPYRRMYRVDTFIWQMAGMVFVLSTSCREESSFQAVNGFFYLLDISSPLS